MKKIACEVRIKILVASILLTVSKTGRAGAEFKMWQTGRLVPWVWPLVGLWLALFFFLLGKWKGNRGRIAHFLHKAPKLQASEKLQKRSSVWKLNFS